MEVQYKEGGGMIIYKTGDILTSEADYLVNPTNFQGPMGGGLARKFADKFPGLEERYIAQMSAFKYRAEVYDYFAWLRVPSGQYVIGFPTMDLGGSADLARVSGGLAKLAPLVATQTPISIAFPKLGCGIGGLDWNDVKPVIEMYFGNIDGLTVEIWE